MHFLVLAADYDGTLAHDGNVDDPTIRALERLRASGRKLVLVTGRHLPDLLSVFGHLDLFDRVIVENGGLLYRPQTREQKPLTEPPHERFLALLKERGVPFSAGRTIVATWKPHEEEVLKAIRDLGLELQVIFNKGAVMVLPSGVNKGTGLAAALDELGLSAHNTVGVGDAENDHAFLKLCECAVAVANALPALRERADIVLPKPRGEGVAELCEEMIASDLGGYNVKPERHSLTLGQRVDATQEPVRLDPRGASILVAGRSGSGKSTAVSGMLEQFIEQGYQFCLIDPEGDYDGFHEALSLGSAKETPDTNSIMRALETPNQSVIVNLLGISIDDRPSFLAGLLPHLQHLRNHAGRPHWLIIDEAHHLLPPAWAPAEDVAPIILENTILITVHPEHVAKAALQAVSAVLGIGESAAEIFRSFAKATQVQPPEYRGPAAQPGEALVWFPKAGTAPQMLKPVRSTRERLRHVRQYAEGELSPQQSFFFRGPESKLNLRAQNLRSFLQLAQGVDDETWMFHLRRGDFSNWFKTIIKDEELARQAAEIERDPQTSAGESREKIKEAVDSRYTASA
ncbi:MAG TPA: HAD-IIB family hydrolase [Candidatus Sulfotelmatobacter sp.]|nr:HAD-IIB family hydrolase [Candidatus Sulfotelmatobacter sp.]